MRRVVILALPGLQTLDLHGPAEVLSTATSLPRTETGMTPAAYRERFRSAA